MRQRWIWAAGLIGLAAVAHAVTVPTCTNLTNQVCKAGDTMSGTLVVPTVTSTAADPADAGFVRLGNTDTVCWEANPTGADICLSATTVTFTVAALGALAGGGL